MPLPRLLLRAVPLSVPAALLFAPIHAAAAQAGTWHSVCSSEVGGSVYVTPVFNTRLNVVAHMSMRPIEREFLQYLMGRFGSVGNAPFPANCARQPTAEAAATTMAGVRTQAQNAGRKLVPVEWRYDPDTALVSLSYDLSRQGEGRNVEPAAGTDHGYCLTSGIGGPQYVSAAFSTGPGANLSLWLNAFDKFLRNRYGYTGNGVDVRAMNPVECNIGSATLVARLIRARSEGARAGGRKVVGTGWKPGDAAAAAVRPAKDDDREPPPAKAPSPPPSADVRRFATDEGTAVLALCQNDRLIDGPFDCYAVQRAIYNYRIAHAGSPPEPLQELFMGEKVDCSSCLKSGFVATWAANRAMSNGFSSEKSECVGKQFEAGIKAHPFPHRARDLFEAAMKACPK